mgnify:CR=1 FL=1
MVGVSAPGNGIGVSARVRNLSLDDGGRMLTPRSWGEAAAATAWTNLVCLCRPPLSGWCGRRRWGLVRIVGVGGGSTSCVCANLPFLGGGPSEKRRRTANRAPTHRANRTRHERGQPRTPRSPDRVEHENAGSGYDPETLDFGKGVTT